MTPTSQAKPPPRQTQPARPSAPSRPPTIPEVEKDSVEGAVARLESEAAPRERRLAAWPSCRCLRRAPRCGCQGQASIRGGRVQCRQPVWRDGRGGHTEPSHRSSSGGCSIVEVGPPSASASRKRPAPDASNVWAPAHLSGATPDETLHAESADEAALTMQSPQERQGPPAKLHPSRARWPTQQR